MRTYVIKDFVGLFHIVTSTDAFENVYARWLTETARDQIHGIDDIELHSKLEEMKTKKVYYHECKTK